jgi:hypothetical protein
MWPYTSKTDRHSMRHRWWQSQDARFYLPNRKRTQIVVAIIYPAMCWSWRVAVSSWRKHRLASLRGWWQIPVAIIQNPPVSLLLLIFILSPSYRQINQNAHLRSWWCLSASGTACGVALRRMAMPWETAASIAHNVFVLLHGWVCTCLLAADEAARLLRSATQWSSKAPTWLGT